MKRIKKEFKESNEREMTRYEYARLYTDLQQYNEGLLERERDTKSYFWQGIDPRRRQQYADGGIVKEDRNAMANLPEKGYCKEYPLFGYYANPLVDTLEKD